MFQAASRLALTAACLLVFGGFSLFAAETPPRTVPSRPVANSSPPARLAVTRINNVDYVELDDALAQLGLKANPGGPGRKVVFGDNQLVIEPESREILAQGLRVFLGEPIVSRKRQLYLSQLDFAACVTPLLRPGFGVPVLPVPKVIALDAGHGGPDDGAENKTLGLKEKELTLDVATRLRKILQTAGHKVVMIRTDDKTLSPNRTSDLAMRPELANRHKADLYISIHFNVAGRDARGTEIFTYTPKAQHATDWWGALSKEDAYLELVEQPINRFDHWNMVFAEALQRRMLKMLGTEDRGKKIAHWSVLKTLDCPGVLVEPAIISNDGEARRVATSEFRQQIAEALAAGVADYAAVLDSLRPKPPLPSAAPGLRPASTAP